MNGQCGPSVPPATLALGSADNPTLVDENGHAVPKLRRGPQASYPSPSGRVLSIYRDPTSNIIGATGAPYDAYPPRSLRRFREAREARAARAQLDDTPDILTHDLSPLGPTLEETEARIAARARARRYLRGTRGSRSSSRRMLDEEVYIGDARPPAHSTSPVYDCGICFNIQSHPVTYNCGHGHCYVCIRSWLQISWSCPNCRARMHSAPVRDLVTEKQIALLHPEWEDSSVVTYSWAGLKFPKPFVVPQSS